MAGQQTGMRRVAAAERMLARVRRIEDRDGVTTAALDAIKAELIELASQEELFPPGHFPVRAGSFGSVYRIAEDADGRFALYGSAGVPGKAQPAHNHTTWAVIAGVRGIEHNVMYRRTDNRSVAGQGSLAKVGELSVVRGNAVGYLPDDFHTIETRGEEASLHLHLYGLSLERLPERIYFPDIAGGAYSVFPAPPRIAPAVVPAAELKAMLHDGDELALLDLREEGVFDRGHLFHAVPMPLSRLELLAERLVPRKSARIVLCDADGGELVRRGAERLVRLGYRNIQALDRGLEGWRDAGYEIFAGVNVPSKAFGEFVEHHDDTPRIEAPALKAAIDRGDDVVVLDSRPYEEFHAMSIPGGIDCPGAELVRRAFDVVRSPRTTIVVNCAGRTRSIIGAQSLINAGIPNRVLALKDGTMGWHLAGFDIARGAVARAPAPGAVGLAKAQVAAAAVARRFGVSFIGEDQLAVLRSEADRRSLFLLDVRDPAEFAAGHVAGSRSAPGGQLVQATDRYVGTRGARLVLIDDDGVRATMTASWLVQMGWQDVFVLKGGLADPAQLQRGSEAAMPPSLALPKAQFVAARDLAAMQAERRVTVIDLDTSLRYRAGHVPGAWFAVRSRLADTVRKLPETDIVAVTSGDGVLARLAAPEIAALVGADVVVLEGGNQAWRAAGLPIETGFTRMLCRNDDAWYRPYDHDGNVEAHMRAYLAWEVDLVAQVERDGDAGFRRFSS
ncbi:rhodanese-like domain-containing protein [Desertibaculum subflavum]|uniref:rhodanese-like domain-containing protein n=1 Tax=Desertibaculum subflavum TaxID=2268458 RepID=UPI000E67064A